MFLQVKLSMIKYSYYQFKHQVSSLPQNGLSAMNNRSSALSKLLLLVSLSVLASCRAFEPKYLASQLPAPYQGKNPLNHDNDDYHNHITQKPYYHLIKSPTQIVSGELITTPTPHYTIISPSVWDSTDSLKYAAWRFNTPQERRYQAYGKFSDFSRYRQSVWSEFAGYKVVCTSLYSIEKGLTTNESNHTLIFKTQALKRFALHLVTGLDKQRLRNVVYDLSIEPFKETLAEYEFLKHQASAVSPSSPQRVVLAEPGTIDSLLVAPNTTAVIISVEGGHVLLGPDVLRNNRILEDPTTPQDAQDIRDRVAVLKSWQYPVFFLTLSHLIWNKLAGQSKGTDADGFKRKVLTFLSHSVNFRSAIFTQPNSGIAGISPASWDSGINLPYDNGSTGELHPDVNKLGLVAINALLSKENGRRILIDLRHSSIKTRLEYYNLLDSIYQDVPPLVSHCAASGKSLRLAIATGLRWPSDDYAEFNDPSTFYNTLASYNKKSKAPRFLWPMFAQNSYSKYFKKDTTVLFKNDTTVLIKAELNRPNTTGWFHPTSNNLADEEIEYITRKGGLMGLTVEQRGLGGSMKQYAATRRASQARFRSWLTHKHPALTNPQRTALEKQFFDAAPFMRNLWYFTNFTKTDADVWQHLTIGSDYDGIADPMDSFATSSRLPNLESFINDYYQAFEEVYSLKFNMVGRPMYQNLRLVFSTNGIEFVKKYYPRR